MTTGEKIRAYRKKNKLTQKKLGELCGIAEPTIRRYELNMLNPKYETLTKIGAALHVEAWDLVDDKFMVPDKYQPTAEDVEDLDRLFPREDDIGETISVEYKFEASLEVKAKLTNAFALLNEEGQQVAIERIEELTEIPKYRKE